MDTKFTYLFHIYVDTKLYLTYFPILEYQVDALSPGQQ